MWGKREREREREREKEREKERERETERETERERETHSLLHRELARRPLQCSLYAGRRATAGRRRCRRALPIRPAQKETESLTWTEVRAREGVREITCELVTKIVLAACAVTVCSIEETQRE
eukprot:COSAG03_NODE_1124_length_4767_cov_15.100257_4_plen_122_part_00